jgi:hypothetical protein
LHIEELHEFVLAAYHSNEKSNRVKCARDVTRMGGGEMNTEFRWKCVKERDHVDNLGVGERIILKGILRK